MSIGKTSNVIYDQDTDIFTLTHGSSNEIGKVIFDIDVTTDYHLLYSTRITASAGSNGYFDARIGDYTDAVSICVYHDQSGGDLYIHHNGYELSNVSLPGFQFGKLQEMEIISKNNSMFIMYEGAYVIDVDFGESNVAFTNGWLEYTACNLEGCSHTLGIFTYEPHFVVNEDTYFNKSVSAKEYFGITLDQVEGCYWSNMDVENNIDMITLGNIGIGTTNPAYNLHVNGTIYGTNYVNVNYNNLTNKPTIPAAQVNSDWNATSGVAQILNKPSITSFNGGTITSLLTINASGANNPSTNSLYVYNPNNSANQDAIVSIRTAGASGGNPFLSFDVAGVNGWAIGIDKVDANKLKFNNSWSSLTSATKMSIETSGNTTISGALTAARVLPYSTTNEASYYNAAIEVRELNRSGLQGGAWK